MASPVAHSIIGLAVGSIVQPRCVKNRAAWLTFSVLAANAPDLDIFAGLATGQINHFHHGASHSLVALAAFSVLAAAAAVKWWPCFGRVAGATALLVGTHLLIDLTCGPIYEEGGTQIFWPLSDRFYYSPVSLFTSIRHGGSDASVEQFFHALFTPRNIEAIGMELFLTLPWLVLAAWVNARRRDAEIGPMTPFGALSESGRLLLRIEQMERRLKWIQSAGLTALIVVPLAIAALHQADDDAVNTHQLVLRDANGAQRAIFLVRPNGLPLLEMYDEQGRRRIVMGVSGETGASGMTFYDEQKRAVLRIPNPAEVAAPK